MVKKSFSVCQAGILDRKGGGEGRRGEGRSAGGKGNRPVRIRKKTLSALSLFLKSVSSGGSDARVSFLYRRWLLRVKMMMTAQSELPPPKRARRFDDFDLFTF